MKILEPPRSNVNGLIVLLLIALATFIGCSSTTTISRNAGNHNSDVLTIKKLNDDLCNKSVVIRLWSGKKYNAEKVIVGPDSTSFLTDNQPVTITNDSVKHYLLINHVGGATEGLLFSGISALLLSLPTYGVGGEVHKGMNVIPLYCLVATATVGGGLAGVNYFYEFSTDTAGVSQP